MPAGAAPMYWGLFRPLFIPLLLHTFRDSSFPASSHLSLPSLVSDMLPKRQEHSVRFLCAAFYRIAAVAQLKAQRLRIYFNQENWRSHRGRMYIQQIRCKGRTQCIHYAVQRKASLPSMSSAGSSGRCRAPRRPLTGSCHRIPGPSRHAPCSFPRWS